MMSSDRPNSSWSDEDKHVATAGLLCVGCWLIGLALGDPWLIICVPVGFVLMTAYMAISRRKSPNNGH